MLRCSCQGSKGLCGMRPVASDIWSNMCVCAEQSPASGRHSHSTYLVFLRVSSRPAQRTQAKRDCMWPLTGREGEAESPTRDPPLRFVPELLWNWETLTETTPPEHNNKSLHDDDVGI